MKLSLIEERYGLNVMAYGNSMVGCGILDSSTKTSSAISYVPLVQASENSKQYLDLEATLIFHWVRT
jgi:hypothetical protein